MAKPASWLLFIHQLPQKPDYLRVKVARRLRALGAKPIKNSVYVLPHSDSAAAALEGLTREVAREGQGRGKAATGDAAPDSDARKAPRPAHLHRSSGRAGPRLRRGRGRSSVLPPDPRALSTRLLSRPHVGHAARRAHRSHGKRLAHPPLGRPPGQVQARRPRLRPRHRRHSLRHAGRRIHAPRRPLHVRGPRGALRAVGSLAPPDRRDRPRRRFERRLGDALARRAGSFAAERKKENSR